MDDVGAPLVGGDDVTMRVFIDNARFGEDLIVSADVKPNTTKFRDDHAGNKVSKVDIRVWGFDLSIKFHYKTDAMIRALQKFYAAKMNAGSAPVTMAIMLAIQERDQAAKRPAYLFSPVVADYNLSIPGMKERLTQSLECWAETWKPFAGV
jgi:hypothetical protein